MASEQFKDTEPLRDSHSSDSVSTPSSGHSVEPVKYKSNNPFGNQDYPKNPWPPQSQTEITTQLETEVVLPPYQATTISRSHLVRFPFKTSNRILDDLKFSPALFRFNGRQAASTEVSSLLNSRPVHYSKILSSVLSHSGLQTLVLNNAVNFIPAVTKVDFDSKNVTVTTIRGLVVSRDMKEISHFKVVVLERTSRSPFPLVDKQEYHVVPKDLVSQDDLNIMSDKSTQALNLLDDAFFVSLNSPLNHIMRVLVYDTEFSADDLKPLIDDDVIRERYLKGIEGNPDSNLETDQIPSPVHCFQTLLKVLKGPILLPAEDPIHTISKLKTSLDAKICLNLLFDKLGFKLGEDGDSLIPPNLSANLPLKESYIRKAYELVFIGKNLKSKKLNDFDVTYSFSDNLSQVHSALAEVDKHSALTMGRTDGCNKFPFFINLSCSTFYQDELIIRCYENTVSSDPKNKIHYVDSLKNIMNYRSSNKSSRLLSYYNNQYMKGRMYGFSDFKALLRALKVEGVEADMVVDPEVIIEMYKTSCRSDPKNYTYYNKQLRIIAGIINSSTLFDYIGNELIPTQIALDEMRIEEVTEDEVVVTAFEFRLDEVMQSVNFDRSNPDVTFLQKCLLSIAVGRKSYILMNYIETKLPEMIRDYQLTYCDALEVLDVLQDTNEFEIISNFQEKLSESKFGDNVDIRALREAFQKIAEQRKSEIMLSFLKQGKIDSSLLPPENWPTGLDNIGNTCYLNSLLQYYFCIKPLRETVIGYDKNALSKNHERRKVGGRFVEESEFDRSLQFIYRLRALFEEMITTRKRCVQPSKELAYLSFLPLSQPVSFKANDQEVIIIDEDMDSDKENGAIVLRSKSPESIDMQLDEQVDDLIEMVDDQQENNRALKLESTENLIDIEELAHVENAELEGTKILSISQDQIDSTIEVGRQQDVTECIENVTFQIETGLEPERLEDDGELYDLIKRLFSGKTKQTITPLDESKNQKARSSFERFFSLIINVGDHPKDIYDALDNYFNEDVVTLEEGEVKKSQTISELPEILQFHIQRVLFDRERLVPYKSLEVIPFGENIYLDRYLETEDEEIKAKRQEVFEWKSQRRDLYSEKEAILRVDPETKLSIVDALKATLKYLETKVTPNDEFDISQDTVEVIRQQIEQLKSRLQKVNSKIKELEDKISSQFSSYQNVGYSLFAIFIHRGEASYGHYWVYIKDPHKNVYRKYNDDNVTEVPASEVLNFTETNTATPYYVVYVKDNLEKDYIEPLKREIV